MNNEKFYDQLNAYIDEYTEEYVHKLKSIAKEILSQQADNGINMGELEDYLQAQEHIFMEKLEQAMEEVRVEVEEGDDDTNNLKEKVLSRIRNSFSKIFEKVVSTLKDILG